MDVTPAAVHRERNRLRENADRHVGRINNIRDRLGPLFSTTADHVTVETFRTEVDTVFENGDRGANITGLIGLLRTVDVTEDYPGFIVDEILGRELAASIAGGQPRRLLAEATFHFADVHDESPTAHAGSDDLEVAIAAGFQTRLPGWDWQDSSSPFAVDPTGQG